MIRIEQIPAAAIQDARKAAQLAAEALSLPRPDPAFLNRIENAYLFERAYIAAANAHQEARDTLERMREAKNAWELLYADAAKAIGLTVCT